METLWEKTARGHTRFGFYFAGGDVVFDYSGPFDTESGEWIYARGHFPRVDFEHSVRLLERERESEVQGAQGERLRFKVLPGGTLSLDFWGGSTNNISIHDLGIGPSTLVESLQLK